MKVRWQLAPSGAAASGGWRERTSTLLIGEGLGECAPLPGLSVDDTRAHEFAVETARIDAEAKRRGISWAEVLNPDAPIEMPCAVFEMQPGATVLKVKAATADIDLPAGVKLRIDANRRWPRDQALAMCARLTGDIEYVEEPCERAWELDLPVPVALDESLAELADREIPWERIAAVVLKPTVLGIERCVRIAAEAKRRGVNVVVTHCLEGPIGTAACAELARAIGTPGVAQGLGPHPALDAWPVKPPQLRGASIRRADGPGLAMSAADIVPRAIVAYPDETTLDVVHAALRHRRPLALVHHRLDAAERDRQLRVALATSLAADDAFVLFTSGSTKQPRGVVLTRGSADAAAEAHAKHLGWRDDDRWLVALSMAHTGGLAVIVRSMAAGRPISLLAGDFEARRCIEQIERDRVTLVSLVPTQLAALLEAGWAPPAHVRAVLLGGAAAPPALVEAALERGVPVLATYGMTESFGQIATALVPGGPLVPLPGVDLEAGTADAPAPIVIRAPMLASRYLDGRAIAPKFTTADLGFTIPAFVVVGRADDVIITGGENVHPAMVENVVAATPGVRAAVAFGLADDRWGQIVGAAIVPDHGADAPFDAPAAEAYWRAHLPSFARPRRWMLVDALPLLPNGKVDRQAAARLLA